MAYEPIRTEPMPIYLLRAVGQELESANNDVVRKQRALMKSLERLHRAQAGYVKTLKDHEMTDALDWSP